MGNTRAFRLGFRAFSAPFILGLASSVTLAQVLVSYNQSTGQVSAEGRGIAFTTLEITTDRDLFLPQHVAPDVIQAPFDRIEPQLLFVLRTGGVRELDFGSVLPTGMSVDDLDLAINGSSVSAVTYFDLFVFGTESPGDFDGDQVLSGRDVARLQRTLRAGYSESIDLNADHILSAADVTYWVHEYAGTWVGDANLDGLFNSTDLVEVFSASSAGNVGCAEGDWNSHGRFDSSDLVAAFVDGGYERGRRIAQPVPEPRPIRLLTLLGLATLRSSYKQRRVQARKMKLPASCMAAKKSRCVR